MAAPGASRTRSGPATTGATWRDGSPPLVNTRPVRRVAGAGLDRVPPRPLAHPFGVELLGRAQADGLSTCPRHWLEHLTITTRSRRWLSRESPVPTIKTPIAAACAAASAADPKPRAKPTTKKTRGPARQPLEVASQPSALLLPSTVNALLGVSGDTLRRMVRAGKFPPPVALSATTHRWPAAAVHAWLAAQAGATLKGGV